LPCRTCFCLFVSGVLLFMTGSTAPFVPNFFSFSFSLSSSSSFLLLLLLLVCLS
jgi:hypothetical protein